MTRLERGQTDDELLERMRGIGIGERAFGLFVQRLVHRADDVLDERLFGQEVAAHGADTHSGAARDLLQCGHAARASLSSARPRPTRERSVPSGPS